MIDAYASLAHYAEHIRPVWEALPAGLRGQWLEPRRLHARDTSRTVLVASWRDAQQVTPSPLVYLEHGAGQSYDGDPRAVGNGSYSGGAGLDRVRLFLCPNRAVADRWRATYGAPAVVVGCPKLDARHRAMVGPRGVEQRPARRAHYPEVVGSNPTTATTGHHRPPPPPPSDPAESPVVAVTFHWECRLVPETRSAWGHYDRALPALAADPGVRVLGHGHPRLWGTIRRRWQKLGVDHTPRLDDVFDQADLLVADNTSAAYEFASLDRPVLVLNAPWYRRSVEHGLRFWTHPPGLQCDQPRDLVPMVHRALADPPAAQRIRRAAAAAAYDRCDGHAADRAAQAIAKEIT